MLKSKKLVKRISMLGLAGMLLFGGAYHTHNYINNNVERYNNEFLVDDSVSLSMAKLYNVESLLCKSDDGELIRFDNQGKTIYVIVDEKSAYSMLDNNIQAIKNAIENYNNLFEYINPDYQFEYISKEEFDKNPTNNPCIYITSRLKLDHPQGEPRAATSPPAVSNIVDYGSVTNNSQMILSSTALVNLTVDEITTIIMHEMGHSLCITGHSEDITSVMGRYGNYDNIDSTRFSADLMYALLSMYYNPETNPRSLKEIKDYINTEDTLRTQEIEIANEQEKKLENEKMTILFSENKEFTNTNMYGLTTTIQINSDGTYLLTHSNNEQELTTQGTYVLENNQCICEGEMITIDSNTKEFVAYNDILRIQYLSDGSIVFGTKSNNFNIQSKLGQLELESEMIN